MPIKNKILYNYYNRTIKIEVLKITIVILIKKKKIVIMTTTKIILKKSLMTNKIIMSWKKQSNKLMNS